MGTQSRKWLGNAIQQLSLDCILIHTYHDEKMLVWLPISQTFRNFNVLNLPFPIKNMEIEWYDAENFRFFSKYASYFHKGLMWRGVKVEKSRKNGYSYDKAIFWQNL